MISRNLLKFSYTHELLSGDLCLSLNPFLSLSFPPLSLLSVSLRSSLPSLPPALSLSPPPSFIQVLHAAATSCEQAQLTSDSIKVQTTTVRLEPLDNVTANNTFPLGSTRGPKSARRPRGEEGKEIVDSRDKEGHVLLSDSTTPI